MGSRLVPAVGTAKEAPLREHLGAAVLRVREAQVVRVPAAHHQRGYGAPHGPHRARRGSAPMHTAGRLEAAARVACGVGKPFLTFDSPVQ